MLSQVTEKHTSVNYFYFNNINKVQHTEIQMFICDKNLGNILNIYENCFVLK